MGDRNNPIKFGPEWLRNLAREERSARSSSSNNQNVAGSSGITGPGTSGASGGGTAPSTTATSTGNAANAGPKVLLAKLRYGREEMLALYDRTSEAPQELRTIDTLFQPRGKPPVALNNSFEDDMRDTMRGPPGGGMAPGERFGMGRGAGRTSNTNEPGREVRGRGTRLALLRQAYGARGIPWNGLRMPVYSSGAEDEATSMRSWIGGSNGGNAAVRNSGESTEWVPNKMFRNKRPGSHTNWRQSTRDDGEEWRSSEPGTRPRTSQQDKWERDWGDRPTQDKPQWNNRRTWVGGDSQSNNDDNLPEWATDGSEACGGTFDSSGAFHGYSNDDSNLPKNHETPYALTRSNTHGSFARSKTVEEGSDEWWASEKAKKLSPKRFDASDIKFKKPSIKTPDANATASSSDMLTHSKEDKPLLKIVEKSDVSAAAPETTKSNTSPVEGFTKKTVRFAESKTFDSLMRSGDINLEEPNDRGNFQSVMITPNNSLRQKHQNIVQAVSSTTTGNKQNRKPAGFPSAHLFQKSSTVKTTGSQLSNQQQSTENKIVDDLMELTLEERKLNQTLKIARGKHPSTSSMSQGMPSVVNSTSNMSNPGMQLNMSTPMQMAMNSKSNISSGMHIPPPRMQIHQSGMQASGMEMQSPSMQMQMQMPTPSMQLQSAAMKIQSSGMPLQSPGMQMQPTGMQMQPSGMQIQSSGIQMPSSGMQMQGSGMQMQGSGMPMQSSGMPGITNSALNASLGLPHGLSNNTMGQTMGMPLQGPPTPVLPSQGMANSNLSVAGMHTTGGIPNFQSSSGIQGMSSSNVANNSLFHGQNTNNASMQSSGDIPMPNHGNQGNMYPMHGLQHSNSAGTFAASIYGNMMPQTPAPTSSSSQDLAEQWYYEDPKQIIQGPFSSKEMFTWFSAGFFSPSLMVRRACDTVMRPLASYGPVVPFAQMDMLSYPMTSGFDSHNQGPQQGLGLDVGNMSNMNDTNSMDSMQFGTVGLMPNQPYGQQQMVDSLWSQPTNPSELMWMQQAMNSRNETRVNNLPMFFWDQQPSAIGSNALLPEEIAKEMKTEDQILAQLRATQNINTPQNMHFRGEPPVSASSGNKPEESYTTKMKTPNLEELQKLIQKDTLKEISPGTEHSQESQIKSESAQSQSDEQNAVDLNNAKFSQAQIKAAADAKVAKQAKSEAEKAAKNKDSNNAKIKSKRTKDDKREDSIEVRTKDDETSKPDQSSEDQSPTKIKKEEKTNIKKEQEKDKKEWIKEKDEFTVVKGVDKSASKDIKKKAEEIKAAEDVERKRKEEERLAAEDEKKKNKAEAIKRQQEIQQLQQHRQASESVNKKAPWSAVSTPASQATSKEGLTLAEIQRLEREKKLEQMKEQQQMMQIIAQQQAAALAREQEMQAGLGWAKKGTNSSGQSLSEIQAEARKQAAAAVAAATAAQVLEEALPAPPPPPALANHVPWGSSQNGGGFWDTQPNQPIVKPQVSSPQKVESIKKKKITVSLPAKKETSPAAEFETWCTMVLASWSTKIDVPTFVGFLKDIESPYEVKDYVKCYLGESKDTGDFARQFLERRSKLLRVGMVTPSDDLCSPALAVNPRTNSGSEYQEVKGKGKKTKKNKMLKVDARILGFSVTAAEDRINVGDIDTA